MFLTSLSRKGCVTMLTFYLFDTILHCFNEILLSFVINTSLATASLLVCVQFLNSFNFIAENSGKLMYMTRKLRDTVMFLKVYQTLHVIKLQIWYKVDSRFLAIKSRVFSKLSSMHAYSSILMFKSFWRQNICNKS